MKNVTLRTYFISADKPNLTPVESAMRQTELIRTLIKLGYDPTPVVGKYNGILEQSVVFTGCIEAETILNKLLNKYNQDAYLIVYYDHIAELVDNTGVRRTLGQFKEVKDPSEKDFTKIGDHFYVVE